MTFIDGASGARDLVRRFDVKEIEATYTISSATSHGGKLTIKLIVRY